MALPAGAAQWRAGGDYDGHCGELHVVAGKSLLAIRIATAALAQTVSDASPASEQHFARNWVFRLGPKVLLALHLEPQANVGFSGYLLRPGHFNMQSTGEMLRFSYIDNKTRREAIVQSTFHDGELTLIEANSSHETLQMRLLDKTHADLKVFAPLPPLRLGKSSAQTPQLATDWDPARSYAEEDFIPDNAEMKAIAEADQNDRKNGLRTDWSIVSKADTTRRGRTLALLRDNQLHTGTDFEEAAFIFQHGSTPDDYLLAHALALAAMAKGESGAVWIASATLDRYLQSIHQPKIFGTQFKTIEKQPTTQDSYNRSLIPDSLRRNLGVPPQKEQDEQRAKYDLERGIEQ